MVERESVVNFGDPHLVRIAQFLAEIGIALQSADLPAPTFLPGILVERGALLVDEGRLTYPGDLLHEAGHLAVMTPEERAGAGPDSGGDGGFEMAAIAWSYSAALHVGIEPSTVFHEHGYHGGSRAILDNFAAGCYFGVPLLEWLGMTAGPKRAAELCVPPYPSMLRWLRA